MDGLEWKKLGNNDEFVLDPTKINLFIGRTGVDGDTFKNKYLNGSVWNSD